MTAAAQAPWIESPFALVSLKEIAMQPQYGENEAHIGGIGNLFYLMGKLDDPISEIGKIQALVWIEYAIPEFERLGLRVSAHHAKDLAAMLNGTHYVTAISQQVMALRSVLHTELDATAFFPIGSSQVPFYREPLGGWTTVLDQFPSSQFDVEEAAKCFALSRFTASVFHLMRIAEIGLTSIAKRVGLTNAKPGWDEAIRYIEGQLGRNYADLDALFKRGCRLPA